MQMEGIFALMFLTPLFIEISLLCCIEFRTVLTNSRTYLAFTLLILNQKHLPTI